MLTIHQAGFNLPFLGSFYYYEGIYGVIYQNASAEIGIKNCHHHCPQQRLQLKILPGQQVGNFHRQSTIQKSQLERERGRREKERGRRERERGTHWCMHTHLYTHTHTP